MSVQGQVVLAAPIGTQGLIGSRIGLGCLGMTSSYGQRDDAESERTLRRAVELGVRLFDTALSYGPYVNEEFVGRVLAGAPADVVIATKVGTLRRADGTRIGVDGSPGYIRSAVDGCLRRLRLDRIGLLYLHRVDPRVPVEESVGEMGNLVRAGKVGYVGLCEVGETLIRRAHATFPLTAIQSEYSLWCREPEDEVLPVTAGLGIGYVSYSPLGRGMITGRLSELTQLAETDERRRRFPWFSAENFDRNVQAARALQGAADRYGASLSQVALAWQLSKWAHVAVIPGTKRRRYLEENCGALRVELSPDEIAALEAAVAEHPPVGARKNADGMARLAEVERLA